MTCRGKAECESSSLRVGFPDKEFLCDCISQRHVESLRGLPELVCDLEDINKLGFATSVIDREGHVSNVDLHDDAQYNFLLFHPPALGALAGGRARRPRIRCQVSTAARERARRQRERPAEEEKKARAEAIVKRIAPCEGVQHTLASMTGAITAATKPGASTTAYEQASSDTEALRAKLAELAPLTSIEQRAKLEESRRFLLKVSTIAEALKTNDLALAQQELSGYRAGMVELSEHVKAAC